MAYRRFFSILLLLCIVFPFVTSGVSAHPGGTDAKGGHTDRSTGEYHYHHGYDSHSHYDMDGDGESDCPYDFDDKTGSSSGIISSSSNSFLSSNTLTKSSGGYEDSYSDGYEKGKSSGYSTGYQKGYDEGYFEGKKVGIDVASQSEAQPSTDNPRIVLLTLVISTMIVGPILLLRSYIIGNRVTNVQSSYEKKIKELNAKHNAAVAQLNRSHEDELTNWKNKYLHEKHNVTLLTIAAGEDPTVDLPPDIRLRKSFTVIKGKRREFYPYGDYTVFMARNSKKYHCSHKCSSAARPMHFFDLPSDADPCRNCVPKSMYPQPLPDWYSQLSTKLQEK